jgi:glyoxylase-like metal-dependent hydrolase (beta-lactamase superfamily II)
VADHPVIHVVHPGAYLQCRARAIEGPSGILLVDPGSGSENEAIAAEMRCLGYELKDVACVLFTHCHIDHAGMAHVFRALGVPLAASRRTAEVLGAGSREVWYEHPELVVPAPVDVVLEDGGVLEWAGVRVGALYTPGHTGGCTTFLIETGDGTTAFTGDIMMGNCQPGWAGSADFSREETLRSLEKLLAVRPDRVCHGHGDVSGEPARWLQRGIELGREGRWQLETVGKSHPVPPTLVEPLTR